MRTIATGIIVFILWSALCTWYYVTRIKAEAPAETTQVEQTIAEQEPGDAVAEPMDMEPEPVSPGSYTVYHEFDQSNILPDPRFNSYLENVASYLDQVTGARISVTGHTDYIGSDDYNFKLGQRRAEQTRDYLMSRGISGQVITTSSNGESTPIASNETSSGRSQNRRTEIELNE